MKKLSLLLYILLSVLFLNCSSKTLNKDAAYQAIETYLEEKPLYESTGFVVGKTRLKVSKDKELITTYEDLEKQGYISFSNQDSRKKWLGKDTIWTATIALTPKANPYIVKLRNNRILVKTLVYKLTPDSNLQIIDKNKRSAQVSTLLFKEQTPFSVFKVDKTPHNTYISKNFKLKFTKDQTWEVVP
ncbi:hypothetical protein ACYSNX_07845 [Myroides sp. LJL115]